MLYEQFIFLDRGQFDDSRVELEDINQIEESLQTIHLHKHHRGFRDHYKRPFGHCGGACLQSRFHLFEDVGHVFPVGVLVADLQWIGNGHLERSERFGRGVLTHELSDLELDPQVCLELCDVTQVSCAEEREEEVFGGVIEVSAGLLG